VTESDASWWYRTPGGDLYGPYDAAQLRSFAIDGRIDGRGSIREGDHGDWREPWEALSRLGMDSAGLSGVPPLVPSPPKAGAGSGSADVSQTAYILLGLLPFLLASIGGIHNLVAGRTAAGVTQLLLSMIGIWGFGCVGAFTGGVGFCVSIPVWIALLVWVIIDVATVRTDRAGRPFRA
jgi:hypothetical protein